MDNTPWKAIATAVMALPQHGKLKVPRSHVPHPREAGLYRSVGLARRCRHYRHALPDGRGLHVHEYDDHYHVHWDAVDPSINVLRHIWHDVKHAIRMRGRHAAPVVYAH